MAQEIIDIGSAPNDGTGDPLRDAFTKCNNNFTELYAALVGLLELKGATDCSANPNYPAASKGDAYRVSVAGKIGGAAGIDVEVGDLYYATADNAGGTQAAVGASWGVLQANTTGGGGGGGTIAIEDEGVEEGAAIDRINFTGAGVSVSVAGSEATVDIPGGGGGGGGGYFNGYTGAEGGVDSSAYATKGHLYTPSVDVEIDSLYFIIDSNGVYQCQIAAVDPVTGEILSIAGTSSTVASIGIAWWNKLTFAVPAALTAGTTYAILLIRTGGAGTDSCSLTQIQNGFMNAPGSIRGEANKLLKYNTVGVTVAQVASVVAGGAMYNMAIEGRIV